MEEGAVQVTPAFLKKTQWNLILNKFRQPS